MQLQLTFHGPHFLLHLFVFLQQVFDLLGLELDFIGVLLVLDHDHTLLFFVGEPSKIPIGILNKFPLIMMNPLIQVIMRVKCRQIFLQFHQLQLHLIPLCLKLYLHALLFRLAFLLLGNQLPLQHIDPELILRLVMFHSFHLGLLFPDGKVEVEDLVVCGVLLGLELGL